MTNEQYKTFTDALEKAIKEREEYETTHDDAGGNYAGLITESWEHRNGPEELANCMRRNGHELTSDELADLVRHTVDWFEMTPGHIFSSETPNRFRLGSFPVEEIEGQYCLPDLARLLETDKETAREFADKAMDDNRFCLRREHDGGFLSYTTTDAVWIAEISLESLVERLGEIREEAQEIEAG